MKLFNHVERYGALSIAMHWLMVLLFIAIYASEELRELAPKRSVIRDELRNWHGMLGMLVFVLVWLRLAISAIGTSPAPDPGAPAWQRKAASLAHVALYALMIGMPLTGWLLLSASGKPIPFFGHTLPALTGTSRFAEDTFEEIHEFGGSVGYLLIGLHAAAALFHHYVLHDRTLLRMLPRRPQRNGRL